ncbi:MAG: hypothetical protein KDA87_01225 [Planctomycetales bacterium]|nr:hypothetical protein [Planctomycetales bacterium]
MKNNAIRLRHARTPIPQILVMLIVASTRLIAQDPNPTWQLCPVQTAASLRGLCVVDDHVAWCSGAGNTVLKTTDGGQTWVDVSVQRSDSLDFRDIHAFDSSTAVIISAGQPAVIYQTTDGGANWSLRFQANQPQAFFDALSFRNAKDGLVMSDPVDGRILLIATADGGQTWAEVPANQSPAAVDGEAGFAASGTNMQVLGNRIWIALGGLVNESPNSTSRLVISPDFGQTWSSVKTPLARNASSGIFSLAIRNTGTGAAVGGNYQAPESGRNNIAITKDFGQTWQIPSGTRPTGFRSCVAYQERGHHEAALWVAVGPSGTDVSTDNGQNWRAVSREGFHAVAFSGNGKLGVATGTEGRIGIWRGIQTKNE